MTRSLPPFLLRTMRKTSRLAENRIWVLPLGTQDDRKSEPTAKAQHGV